MIPTVRACDRDRLWVGHGVAVLVATTVSLTRKLEIIWRVLNIYFEVYLRMCNNRASEHTVEGGGGYILFIYLPSHSLPPRPFAFTFPDLLSSLSSSTLLIFFSLFSQDCNSICWALRSGSLVLSRLLSCGSHLGSCLFLILFSSLLCVSVLCFWHRRRYPNGTLSDVRVDDHRLFPNIVMLLLNRTHVPFVCDHGL